MADVNNNSDESKSVSGQSNVGDQEPSRASGSDSSDNSKSDLSDWSSKHPRDVFALLEQLIKQTSFVWKNQKPTVVTSEKLEKSNAISTFKELLNEELANGCDEVSDNAAAKLECLSKMDMSEWQARVGMIIGVPGSGKTTLLKAMSEEVQNSAIVLPNVGLLNTVYAGFKNAFTTDDLWCRPVDYAKYSVLLVDEFTECHMCELMCVACHVGAKNVILFGDHGQGRNYKQGSEVYYNFPVLAESEDSKRLGSEIAEFASKGMNHKMKGNGKESKVSLDDLLGQIDDMATVICMTEATKNELLQDEIEAKYVKDVQGQTYEVVSLVLYDSNDQEAICDHKLRTIAFTRASRLLQIKAESEIFAMITNADYGCKGMDAVTTGEGCKLTR
jgi:energy-coupling factor transporter ATP-binding protein EcfA2